jgi:competence protein ComEA
MSPEKLNRLWLLATGLLILIIVSGSVIIFLNRDVGQPLSINFSGRPAYSGSVYIDGAVERPGNYVYGPDDTLNSLLEASGGLQNASDTQSLQLHIPSTVQTYDSQKVDINRAPRWLLEALPGIGETKARAIIDYRLKIGRFNNIQQLTEVPGINQSLFDKIQDNITAGD